MNWAPETIIIPYSVLPSCNYFDQHVLKCYWRSIWYWVTKFERIVHFMSLLILYRISNLIVQHWQCTSWFLMTICYNVLQYHDIFQYWTKFSSERIVQIWYVIEQHGTIANHGSILQNFGMYHTMTYISLKYKQMFFWYNCDSSIFLHTPIFSPTFLFYVISCVLTLILRTSFTTTGHYHAQHAYPVRLPQVLSHQARPPPQPGQPPIQPPMQIPTRYHPATLTSSPSNPTAVATNWSLLRVLLARRRGAFVLGFWACVVSASL